MNFYLPVRLLCGEHVVMEHADALAAFGRRCLLVTGGSDYHCDDNRHGQPGSTCLHWHQAGEDVAALLQAMDEQSKR